MLKAQKQRDRLTVCLCGDLDHCSSLSVRVELDRLLADPRIRHLTLDMKDMPFMDSSGIGVLLGRYKTLSARGGSLSVKNMSAQVRRIFTLSGMGQIIEDIQNESGRKYNEQT